MATQKEAAIALAKAAATVEGLAGQYWIGRVADAQFQADMTQAITDLETAVTDFNGATP